VFNESGEGTCDLDDLGSDLVVFVAADVSQVEACDHLSIDLIERAASLAQQLS
jgi:hypothetical protein